MENPITRITILNLDHFPAYQKPEDRRSQVPHISTYLKRFMNEKLCWDSYLELPSMSVLAAFFKCSHLEVYDAFRLLRAHGFDYSFSSLDGAVRVWKPTKDRGYAEMYTSV